VKQREHKKKLAGETDEFLLISLLHILEKGLDGWDGIEWVERGKRNVLTSTTFNYYKINATKMST